MARPLTRAVRDVEDAAGRQGANTERHADPHHIACLWGLALRCSARCLALSCPTLCLSLDADGLLHDVVDAAGRQGADSLRCAGS